MENDRTDGILQRIEAIERKLDVLSHRIEQLETPATRRVFHTPPPVQPQAKRRAFFAPQTGARQPTAPGLSPVQTAPQIPVAPRERKDTEYLIGAQIIPKAGAIMMLLGLTFLAVLAYSRGWITPSMMFGIEVAFCGAFVVTGILKRDMKEEFGQILTGVGSCGWYLVFAGGHLYYHLYSGETLVGLYFALSLANLAFSLWRSSRSFFALGLLGGLITASVLPNLQSDHSVLNAWIHFLILAPAALIVAKNKWMSMSICLWLGATVALIPILTHGLPWFDKVAILYASTAVCVVALGRSYKPLEFDEWNSIVPLMLWVSGLIGLALEHSRIGAWQYLGFFVLFGGMAAAFKSKPKMWQALLFGAVGVPITVAPYCFPQAQAAGILASLSILAALVGLKFAPKVVSMIALGEFLLGAVTYLQMAYNTMPWRTEATLVSLLIVAAIASGRALVKGYGQNESYTLAAMAICIPFFSRLGVILLGLPQYGQRSEFSIDLVLVVFSYYALALYFRTSWRSALVAFWVVYGLALTAYLGAATWLNIPLDVSLLIPLMLAPALSLTVTPDNIHTAANAWVALIVGALFTRLAVVLAVPFLHWSSSQTCVVAAVLYSAACFAIVWARKKAELAYAGWVLLAFAGLAYATDWSYPLPLSLWLISAILACLVLGGRATAPVSKSRREFAVAIALAGWVVFSRWAWVLLALTIPSLDSSPAVSISWIAYFFGLIVLGFSYRVAQFRYVSFAVLATTIGKIILIDLATTDAMIRVAVTIVAGLVMLGAGGYWYIRPKTHAAIAGHDHKA